jgi:hypothetical protein
VAFKKRRMMFLPEINAKSFVFFFERGNSGTSWSIRDYSIRNRVKEYGPHHLRWTADDIHEKAQHSLDAPTVSTDNLTFWYEHTRDCNSRFLTSSPAGPSVEASTPQSLATSDVATAARSSNGGFPVLSLEQLLGSAKGRKTQDMDRILHSANSEDWVTWNFFQIILRQYPDGWWGHFISAARRRNPTLTFSFDDQSLPTPAFWSSVRAPSEYEAQSRLRMKASDNPHWALRANDPEPVEGASEIDVIFDHGGFLVYTEAKLGSDVSMSTTYDPQRNQIVRNIDCLLANAGGRMPMFWLLVRDEAPTRAYVQLMRGYRNDPSLLVRDLPHRDSAQLEQIAKNLTILLWSDFAELTCGPGDNPEINAVKAELARRILSR